VTLSHEHRAGEIPFVDYAGQTVEITNRLTEEIRKAQIFVAVGGGSDYICAEPAPSPFQPAEVICLRFFCANPIISGSTLFQVGNKITAS